MNPELSKLGKIVIMNRDDMKKMTFSMDTLFIKNERRLFATEGSSGGVKWKKLSKAYSKAKRSDPKRSNKIMQSSGRLRRGLAVKGDKDHVARSIGLTAMVFGVKNILPVYHGAVRGSRKNPKLPRRSVFQMKPKQRRGYYQILFRRFELKRKQFMRTLRSGRAAMRASLGN